MTKLITRHHLAGGEMIEVDDGEWVRYADVARFLPGYDRGREHPNTWPPAEPESDPQNIANNPMVVGKTT